MEAADPTRLRRTAIGSDCKEDLSLSAGPETTLSIPQLLNSCNS